MLIDSPYFPDELEALPGLLAGAGFEPDALLATHADFDHLLGRLAFPGLALGLRRAERGAAPPGARRGAARRCATRTTSSTWSGPRRWRSARCRRCRCPAASSSAPRSSSCTRPMATPPTAWRVMARWCGVLCVGDYLSRTWRSRWIRRRLARRLPRHARPPGAAGGGGRRRSCPATAPRTTARPRCASSTRTWTTWTRWSAERSSRLLPKGRDTGEQRDIHARNLKVLG